MTPDQKIELRTRLLELAVMRNPTGDTYTHRAEADQYWTYAHKDQPDEEAPAAPAPTDDIPF